MASGVSQAQEYDLSSVVRGHHVYKDVWTLGEQLLVEKEGGNEVNTIPTAMALKKCTNIQGQNRRLTVSSA